MIRRLISLALVVVVGLLIYNALFGTEEEKAEVRQITQEVKQVGKAVKELLKSEREKYDEGKYDKIIQKLKSLKGVSEEFDQKYGQQIDQIEQQSKNLDQQQDELNSTKLQQKEEELVQDIEQLMEQIEQQEAQ